ncbi:MAG: DUF4405 domain-containing protein [Maritimibacter sp.]|nr:DUF4405 domain-containing protein [Maritimibacter sp.]
MKSLRSWATPLIIGSFLIMGVSGTLMFFHAETTLMKVVHEWAGWLLLVGAVSHVALNWRAFTLYFKRPVAAGIMGAGAVILALTLVPVSGPEGGGDFTRTAMRALSGGEIATLAALSGADTDSVLAQLGAAGFEARATDTPASLAKGDRGTEMRILSTILSE